MVADNVFKRNLGTLTNTSTEPRPKGRPPSSSIYEVLGNGDHIEASEPSLRECSFVAMTASAFPLLSYVNEPISHLTNPTVRPLAPMLSDLYHESCSTPQNISMAYEYLSPYVSDASQITRESLSVPLRIDRIFANDGDGLVEIPDNDEERDDADGTVGPAEIPGEHTEDGPLKNAVYHRLHAIDAPELFCTTFINYNGNVLKRHNGHLSHLAVHYYLNSFVRPRGTSEICKEIPRFGDTPKDIHNRHLSVFWLVWRQRPSIKELVMLDEILSSVEDLDNTVKGSLMSTNINPREADADHPFLLKLNALLVLSGFSHVYTK